MGKLHVNGKMAKFTKGSIKKINKMGTENFSGLITKFLKEIGLTV